MTSNYSDTIVAPATIPGTGAISIVRLSGPEALSIADAVVQTKGGRLSESKGYTLHFGEIHSGTELLDQVLVSVFRAPHSYTGEDCIEISTHASAYIVQETVRMLLNAGARLAEPGEYTRRAFLNGKMDLAQAEAVADVISSTTLAAHRVAMHQLKGGFSSELAQLRESLLEMASLLELELDFSEEEVEFADRRQLEKIVAETYAHVSRLAASFRQGNMIKNGIPVAIVGPANAGKSSLLNALIGEERALVSDIPGTTRDSIEEVLNLDGLLFRFIDTAGIREASDTVEKMGIARAFRKISEAEIVLSVLDPTVDETTFRHHLETLLSRIDLTQQKLFLLLNKCDLSGEKMVNKNVTTINTFVSETDLQCIVINISARNRMGLDELKKALVRTEKDLISSADTTFVTNERHHQALLKAASALQDVSTSLTRQLPTELVAEDLRCALSAINAILGTDLLDPDTILHSIFSKHCIGK